MKIILHPEVTKRPAVEPSQLGLLANLIGVWDGTGVDVAPGPDGGSAETPFLEEMKLEPVPVPVLSFGSQTVHALRYYGKIWINGKSFTPMYEENGYFLWIPEQSLIVRQVSNPRGASFLASGQAEAGSTQFTVTAKRGDPNFGVLDTPYLEEVFYPVQGFESTFASDGNTLQYSETTILNVNGQPFSQSDKAQLTRQG